MASGKDDNVQLIDNKTDRATIVRDFCATTTGHGFFKVYHTEHKGFRALWFTLLIVAFIGSFIHIGLNIKRYLDYDVNAEIEIKSEFPFEFPDVTICPNSRYYFRGGLKPMYAKHPYYLSADARVPSLGDNVTFEKIWNNAKQVWYQLMDNPANDSERGPARFSTNPYTQEAQVVLHKLAVTTKCLYKGRDCNHENFTLQYHPDLNLCVTFKTDERTVTQLDPSNGLRLQLYVPFIGSDDAEEGKFMTAQEVDNRLNGATVVLHPSNTMPSIGETSFVISRGKKATISMEMQTIQYMEVNNRCSSSLESISLVESNQTFTYSRAACRQVWKQARVVKECQCRSELYYTPTNLKTYPYCHHLTGKFFTFDNYTVTANRGDWQLSWSDGRAPETISVGEIEALKSRYQCHKRITDWLEQESDSHLADCPIPCKLSTYEMSINIAEVNRMDTTEERAARLTQIIDLVALWRQNGYYTQVGDKQIADMRVSNVFSRSYLAELTLYPAVRMRKLISESLTYPMENFLSDLGGVFGFWLGFSIITIIEVVELAALLFGTTFCFMNKTGAVVAPASG